MFAIILSKERTSTGKEETKPKSTESTLQKDVMVKRKSKLSVTSLVQPLTALYLLIADGIRKTNSKTSRYPFLKYLLVFFLVTTGGTADGATMDTPSSDVSLLPTHPAFDKLPAELLVFIL